MDQSTLDLFWKLSAEESDTRLEGIAALVEHSKKANETEREYIVKRLVRGVQSSRAGAREGFSTALAWFLQNVKDTPIDDIANKVLTDTHVKSKEKGPEAREGRLGRLFGGLALLRSGRLFEKGHGKLVAKVLEGIVQAAESKAWLNHAGMAAALHAIKAIPERAFVPHVQSFLAQHIPSNIAQWGPSHLALFLVTAANHSSKKFNLARVLSVPGFRTTQGTLSSAASTFPKTHYLWNVYLPLIIPESSVLGTVKQPCWPLLKPWWSTVWDGEGGLLLRGLAREGTALALLHRVIERFFTLTEGADADARDAAAAQVATALLGRHTVACLATSKSKRKQAKLRHVAANALSSLEQLAVVGKKAGEAVTAALLTHSGSDFDARAHCQALQKAMTAAGGAVASQVLREGVTLAVDGALKACREAVAAEGADAGSRQPQCDSILVKASHSLSNALLLSGPAIHSDEGVGVVNVLAAMAYFTNTVPLADIRGAKASPKAATLSSALKSPVEVAELLAFLPSVEAPQLRDAGVSMLKGALRKALDESSDAAAPKRSVADTLTAINAVSARLLSSIASVQAAAGDCLTLRLPLPMTAPRLFQRVNAALAAFTAGGKGVQGWRASLLAAATAILRLQCLLVYESPLEGAEGLRDALVATVTLAESQAGVTAIGDVSAAAFRKAVMREAEYDEEEGDSSDEGEGTDSEEEEDVEDGRSPEDKAIAVLTEVVVAMLANAAQFVREATRPVFHALCPLLTPEAIAGVVDVVVGNAAGEEEGEEDKDSDEEMEGSSDEEDEEEEEEEEEEEDEETKEEAESSEEETEAAEGNGAGPAAANDASKDSDSEEDLDLEDIVGAEEAADMRRQDAALANIIRLRKAQQKAEVEARQNDVHFRLRVLDLIQEVLQCAVEQSSTGADAVEYREQPWSLVLRCLPPLLELFRSAASGKVGSNAAQQSTKAKEEESFAFVARVSGLAGKLKRLRLPASAAVGLDEVLELRIRRMEEAAEAKEADARADGEEAQGDAPMTGPAGDTEEEELMLSPAEGSGADHLLLLVNQLLAFVSSASPPEVIAACAGYLSWALKELMTHGASPGQARLSEWLSAFVVSLCDLLSQKKATKAVREVITSVSAHSPYAASCIVHGLASSLTSIDLKHMTPFRCAEVLQIVLSVVRNCKSIQPTTHRAESVVPSAMAAAAHVFGALKGKTALEAGKLRQCLKPLKEIVKACVALSASLGSSAPLAPQRGAIAAVATDLCSTSTNGGVKALFADVQAQLSALAAQPATPKAQKHAPSSAPSTPSTQSKKSKKTPKKTPKSATKQSGTPGKGTPKSSKKTPKSSKKSKAPKTPTSNGKRQRVA